MSPSDAALQMSGGRTILHGQLVAEGVHQDHGAHEEADGLVVPGARKDTLHRRPDVRQFDARAAELVGAVCPMAPGMRRSKAEAGKRRRTLALETLESKVSRVKHSRDA